MVYGQVLTRHSGKTLTIEAVGTFKEDIAEGAYVVLQVKYGLIKLLSTTADLCEQIKTVDMDCPIKKGETTITKEVELPAQIPPVRHPPLYPEYLMYSTRRKQFPKRTRDMG